MTAQEQKQKLLAEALTWMGTPYHDNARLKGIGADCLTFIGAFENAGLIEPVVIPTYCKQWHLHRTKELYLEGVRKYCNQVDAPEVADIGVWKFGRCFSHGAIFLEQDRVIHTNTVFGFVHTSNPAHDMFFFDNAGRPLPVTYWRLKAWC